MPLPGALVILTNDIEGVRGADVIDRSGVFLGLAIDTTYPVGTILGRVTASDKISPSDTGAADGTEVPIGVLDIAIVTDNPVVDQPFRYIIAGEVVVEKLSFFDAATVDDAVLNQLKATSIIARSRSDISKLDNS